jgi:hypothetical protein
MSAPYLCSPDHWPECVRGVQCLPEEVDIHGERVELIVRGRDAITRAAAALIAMSTPFFIEPYPDDDWRLVVRTETAIRMYREDSRFF